MMRFILCRFLIHLFGSHERFLKNFFHQFCVLNQKLFLNRFANHSKNILDVKNFHFRMAIKLSAMPKKYIFWKHIYEQKKVDLMKCAKSSGAHTHTHSKHTMALNSCSPILKKLLGHNTEKNFCPGLQFMRSKN
jgi:hypothetical protein